MWGYILGPPYMGIYWGIPYGDRVPKTPISPSGGIPQYIPQYIPNGDILGDPPQDPPRRGAPLEALWRLPRAAGGGAGRADHAESFEVLSELHRLFRLFIVCFENLSSNLFD